MDEIVSRWWSCLCGQWTASDEFAANATDADVCHAVNGCGTPLVRSVTTFEYLR